MKKMTWSLVRDHAQVLAYDGRRLTLGLSTVGLTATFGGGAHGEYVRLALIDVLGVDAQVDGVHGGAPPAPPAVDASARSDHQRQAPSATAPLDVQPIPPQDDEPPPPPDPQDFAPPARLVQPAPAAQPAPAVQPADDEAADDDADVADSGLVGQPVVEQLLGGRVIDESDD